MTCKKNDCFACPYPDCIIDHVPPLVQLTEERKKQIRDRGKARYQERRAAGLCVQCGKRSPETGKVRCWSCLAKDARNHRDPNAIPRILFDGVGRCKNCGRPELRPGKKICPVCYEKSCRTLVTARAARGKNVIWDGLNSLIFSGAQVQKIGASDGNS